MKIREIFDKEIDRSINPAVVVSNKKRETIEAEIKEYIFTDDLLGNLYKLLDTIANTRGGKTGIWINGYYGSGKSHFIKYIHYCINPDTAEEAFHHLIEAAGKYSGGKFEVTPSNIALLKKKIQGTQYDNIMFNVEDVTADGDQKERLTRVFLDMLNKFRGYNANDIPLAILFEKYLDRKGKFSEFKQLIKEELKYDWEQDAAQVASFELEGVLQIAKRLVPEMDTEALHNRLSSPDSFKVGIEGLLIPELRDFLKDKGKDYRLLFLVDEISQYIGSNKEILLNFQNIIERISEDLDNQVWIACTAQQTLEEVSSGTEGTDNIKDEFGKILGRFDTRISLQSNDASYITQKRVLDKNSEGIEALSKIYRDKKDYIQNQFKIQHSLYKGYNNLDDFILAYPFIPYQFKLVAHVFEAFQQLQFVIKEVKDNERSVLGITHYTTKENADKPVGEFMPFDAFFNRQFSTNLTQRGSRAIQNGLELPYVKTNPFAERVVKTLFMISNLSDTARITFPSNIDNLTVLMMTELDQNRMQLQNQIKEVLDKLIEGSIIREEKGSYFFFNEDEIDVQNQIKHVTLSFEDKLSEFDKFFRNLTDLSPKFSFGQNDFRIQYAIDDKEVFRNGDFKLTVLLTDTTDAHQKAFRNANSDLIFCVNEWFLKDDTLRKDFEWYVKTTKFFSNNSEPSTGSRAKTFEVFSNRNKSLKDRITQRLQSKFPETRFISGSQIIEASQINGTLPVERVKRIIEKHLERLYKFHKESIDYARNQTELKRSAADNQILLPELTPAEQRIDDFITSHGDEMTIEDLIREFDKPPFGWRFEAVLDVLVRLVKKKKREFIYRNQPRFSIVEFINKAVSTPERAVCVVKAGEEIDQSTIDKAIQNFRTIFNIDVETTSDGNKLFEDIKHELGRLHRTYIPLEKEYYRNYPFGDAFKTLNEKLQSFIAIREQKALFNRLEEEQQTAKAEYDLAKSLADFFNRARGDYDAIQQFYSASKENFAELSSPSSLEKADKIKKFLNLSDPVPEFRHIIKAYKELKEDISKHVGSLKEEVTNLYDQLFHELEAEAQKQGITEPHVYSDRERTLLQIKSISSITQLKYKKSQASSFKSDELSKIIGFAAKKASNGNGGGSKNVGEPQEYYLTKKIATISSEDELEEYLQKIKKEMADILKANKTIILK